MMRAAAVPAPAADMPAMIRHPRIYAECLGLMPVGSIRNPAPKTAVWMKPVSKHQMGAGWFASLLLRGSERCRTREQQCCNCCRDPQCAQAKM
jgi:hypothetical protein